MKTGIKSRGTVITVPLSNEIRDALDTLKAQGIQKGHWVAQAIREKLERDGLIGKEGQA
jgi:predicted transcriptional regulator